MSRNYLNVIFRTLRRNKSYTLLNLLGLSLGITCCLLIFVVVRHELRYDTHHAHPDRIFRIVVNMDLPSGTSYNSGAPFPLHAVLQNDLPELEQVAILYHQNEAQVAVLDPRQEVAEQKFKEEFVGFVNPAFLQTFHYTWLAGDPARALADPDRVVLTQKLANKYFGGVEQAMGRTIRVNNKYDLQVTGVVADPPTTTDLPFSLLGSFLTVEKDQDARWGATSSSLQHFVRLPSAMSVADLAGQLEGIKEKHVDKPYVPVTHYLLQPLPEMHFDARYNNPSNRVTGREVLWALAAIAVFLIITASINFVNLATAQAVTRAKEVGVRKVLGSSRRQLGGQFLGETATITVAAMLAAVCLVELVLPGLSRLLDLQLNFSLLSDPVVLGFVVGLTLLVSLLAGGYPALVLSGFSPVAALKNKVSPHAVGGLTMRRGLVVAQFVISQVLIICTLVVMGQLDHFRQRDLGFRRDAILTLPLPENDASSLTSLRNQLQALPAVRHVTFGSTSPSSQDRMQSSFRMPGLELDRMHADLKFGDAAYPETYGLRLLAGRFYGESDTIREVVVNEALLRKVGIEQPEEALGRRISFHGEHPIVGVIQDFNVLTLHEPIAPVIMAANREQYFQAAVHVSMADLPATLRQIEAAWTSAYPAYVFDYTFLDKTIADFYERENQLARLFQLFAGISIFIGCLGLYGLVSFMAVQRTKEIGVRKVLGASVASIVGLFSKEFLLLIGVAFVIAAPLGWYLMRGWLQDFEYRIPLGPELFLAAVGVTLVIAALTVGYRSIRAALANPVESLRSE